MPVAEFSKLVSISENQVVKMIQDGFYAGQIKNNFWYVDRTEVKKEDWLVNTASTYRKEPKLVKKEFIPVEEFADFKEVASEKVIQMIKDGFYQGRVIEDQWYISYSEVDDSSAVSYAESTGLFSKLIRGELGLAKTYWLYQFSVTVIVNFIMKAMSSVESIVILMLGYTIYGIPVLLGVWRASSKYQGRKVWAVLAKIVVILSWFGLAFGLYIISTL